MVARVTKGEGVGVRIDGEGRESRMMKVGVRITSEEKNERRGGENYVIGIRDGEVKLNMRNPTKSLFVGECRLL